MAVTNVKATFVDNKYVYEMVTGYHGLVLGTSRQWNSLSETEVFHAIVWNEEAQRTQLVAYGSDRDYEFNGSAEIDATPEVVAKANAYEAERKFAELLGDIKRERAIIAKGKEVVVARGRKVAKGTTGKVMWMGATDWGMKVGLRVEGHDKLVYVMLKNLDAVVGEIDEEPIRRAAQRTAKNYNHLLPAVAA